MIWAQVIAGVVKMLGILGEVFRIKLLKDAGAAEQRAKDHAEAVQRVAEANIMGPGDISAADRERLQRFERRG